MASEQPWFEIGEDRLRLLVDGPERLDALIALIDGARESLRLLFYIFADDRSGARVRDALAAAAARGVAVALIVDGFGSDQACDREFFAPLVEAGGDVCIFLPGIGRRQLLRNHQKLALADGTYALTGGFNIEDSYFGTIEDGAWRDLGLEIEGAAVTRIVRYFDRLKRWASHRRATIRALRPLLREASEREGQVRWLIGGPTPRLSPWAVALRDDLRTARRIDMIAAYFAPTPGLLRRLRRAARRGAKMRIVTAAKSDNTATIAAARFTYRKLLEAGARLFEYESTKLHTKLYVADDAVHIGSANFDVRSLFLNLEIMLRIEDADFARHVRDYVDGEIAGSTEITAALHRERTGPWRRVKQFGAYVLIAVLDYNLSRRLNFGVDGK